MYSPQLVYHTSRFYTNHPVNFHTEGFTDMSGDVNDLSINYEEEGTLIVRELDKEILSKGAWTTILFRYQDLDRRSGEYGPEKYTIRRYQKQKGQFIPKSKFNISSKAQAQKIIDTLTRWIDKE